MKHLQTGLKIILSCSLVLFFFSFKKGTTKPKIINKPISTIVKDADSNVYSIIIIGKQQWMGENLKTTHYTNGKIIPYVKDSGRWAIFNSGAYTIYGNDTLIGRKNGLLYNWFAVNDSQKICPNGWHVPTDADWTILDENLGGTTVAGGKMKDTIAANWTNAFGNTNESGFKALSSGCRTNKGTYSSLGFYGLWWSSTENYATYAWYRCVNYNSTDLFRHYYYKRYGFSIRCLKD